MLSFAEQRFTADTVPILTQEVEDFWSLYDRGLDVHEVQAALLQGIIKGDPLRRGTAPEFVAFVREHKDFYENIRAASLESVRDLAPVREAIRGLVRRFPKARLTPIRLAIGRMRTGGTVYGEEAFVAVEMFSRTASNPTAGLADLAPSRLHGPEYLPAAVVHELVHQQQSQRTDFPLYETCLREGAADFIAELVTGRNLGAVAREWAEPRRDDLFRRFRRDTQGGGSGGWLYGDPAPGQPRDLGYWIGSDICARYWRTTKGKQNDVREIAQMRRPKRILSKALGWKQ